MKNSASMWKVVFVVVCSLIVVESCEHKDFECAPFTVVENHTNYRILSFPALTWVTIIESDRQPLNAKHNAFLRLFRYTMGKNDKRENIRVGVPYREKIIYGEEEVTVEWSWLLPKALADDPPIPFDKNITINKEGPRMFAVRPVSSYLGRTGALDKEVEKLKNSTLEDATIDKTEFYKVSYNGPFAFSGVEIWMKKMPSKEQNTE